VNVSEGKLISKSCVSVIKYLCEYFTTAMMRSNQILEIHSLSRKGIFCEIKIELQIESRPNSFQVLCFFRDRGCFERFYINVIMK